ncbi:MAG TPA: MBL fold metallo-hydrolase [Acidimicrobiia bacterium]|nr:MBL fold metallo-hydrolase [Acidimicrobiia bacterium]
MADFLRVNRRLFLAQMGKGTMALVVFGACGDTGGSGSTPSTSSAGPTPSGGTTSSPATTSPATSSASSTTSPAAEAQFRRVNLGFVSAYIVVRGSEAAIVDTGVSGSEGDIEAALGEVGLGWEQVGHVILTHRHPDHQGSAPAVLEAASFATGYAGEGDLDSITAPRPLTAVVDGDSVFGLDVVGTPGHTAGHICLLDPVAEVLVAGDALVGAEGGVAAPDPQFSSDHDEALRSVEKLAGLAYEQILFGHGDPVTSGGSGLVADLAAGL